MKILFILLMISTSLLMYTLFFQLIIAYLKKKPANRILPLTILILAFVTFYIWGFMRNLFPPFWA